MSERAQRRMTVAEFLQWDDGTDTRYELVDGVAVAMAPPAHAHGRLSVRLGTRIEAALSAGHPQCSVQNDASIALSEKGNSFYVADLAVSCMPIPDEAQLIQDPVLIVEILSPSTSNFDRQVKVPEYRRIVSVEEILLVDSRSIFAEVQRRVGEQWVHEIVQGRDASLTLHSIGLSLPMAELYEGLDLAAVG